MLRFHKIPFYDGKFHWQISSLSGSLMKSEHLFLKKKYQNNKIDSQLYVINNPYEVDWKSDMREPLLSEKDRNKLEAYKRKLFSLGNDRFFRSIFFAFKQRVIFDNSQNAFAYISRYKHFNYGSENCLQRCLLVAKTSKTFKQNGAIFIGAMPSTFEMHAWIIEKSTQPDFQDRVWINYRPLLAITF